MRREFSTKRRFSPSFDPAARPPGRHASGWQRCSRGNCRGPGSPKVTGLLTSRPDPKVPMSSKILLYAVLISAYGGQTIKTYL